MKETFCDNIMKISYISDEGKAQPVYINQSIDNGNT